jgi:hypothetical protein
MAKPHSNRTNFKYASWLAERGWKTAIHALSPTARKELNQLLAEGKGLTYCCNIINQKYDGEIKEKGLKPISLTSLKTYRNKHWHKEPAVAERIIETDPKLSAEARRITAKIDCMGNLEKLANTAMKRLDRAMEAEQRAPMPLAITTNLIDKAFDYNERIMNIQMDLGLLKRAPTELDITTKEEPEPDEMTEEAKEKRAERMILAAQALMGKGRYGKRNIQISAGGSVKQASGDKRGHDSDTTGAGRDTSSTG